MNWCSAGSVGVGPIHFQPRHRDSMANRVLIIGGTGLISSVVVQELIARGDEVTVFSRGKAVRPLPAGAKHWTGDRTDRMAFVRQMRTADAFDCVIDMVCFDPADAECDVRAFAGRTRQLIFCSTVDVYAKPSGPARYPVVENEPLLGLNDYGRGKVACECVFAEAHRRGDFAVTVFRPAHTCDDRGALIHSFGGGNGWVDRLRRGLPIIVHGDGTSLWCVAHADDVGPAFAAAVGNPVSFGNQYNVASDELLSWNALYIKAAAAMGWPAPVLVHVPTDVLQNVAPDHAGTIATNFQFSNVFDNSAARRDLGFCCTTRFDEMARRILGRLVERNAIIPGGNEEWYDRLIALWQEFSASLSAAFRDRRQR